MAIMLTGARAGSARRVWTRLAAAVCCLALLGVLGLTRPTPVHASGDRIDVGVTILQGNFWKGSGSFSNPDNSFGQVCVALWLLQPNGNPIERNLSQRCVPTPPGSGFAFSAPDVHCSNLPSIDGVFTTVVAYDHTLVNPVLQKQSNQIAAHC
jgi:hypothetical protein